MTNDRETKNITTPSGKLVVIKAWLNGREANELKAVLYKDLKMSMADVTSGGVKVTDVSGEFILEQEKKALELFLVSIEGKSENLVETFLDLPENDYKAVIKEINALRADFQKEK